MLCIKSKTGGILNITSCRNSKLSFSKTKQKLRNMRRACHQELPPVPTWVLPEVAGGVRS